MRSRLAALTAATTVASLLTVPGVAQAATIDVSCSEASLRSAIDAVNGNGESEDTIELAAGCRYTLTTPLPEIDSDLELNGNGATITRSGTAAEFGLLVLQQGLDLQIIDVTLSNGIDTSFVGGGALYALGGTTITITDSHLRDNTARYGGAIFQSNGTGTLLRSAVTGNVTTGSNTATMDLPTGWSVIGSTISGNTGDGLRFTDEGSVTIRNSTIAGNTGDAVLMTPISGSSTLTTTATIIDSSSAACSKTGGGGTTTFTSGGYNVLTDTSCGTPLASDRTNVPDTGLRSLSSDGNRPLPTHGLKGGSPAIGLIPATNSRCATNSNDPYGDYSEQNGRRRTSDGSCDAGAHEELPAPPTTSISSGPTASSTVASTSATFELASSPSGSNFMCRLDEGTYASCTATKTYSGLSEGSHTFTAYAVSPDGPRDLTPVTRTWTVDSVAPKATLTGGPSGSVTSRSATFTFTSSESGTFQCKLDSGSYSTCTSPKTYTGRADGSHTFSVRATDSAGNTDRVTRTWTVDATAPTTNLTSVPTSTTSDDSPTFTFTSSESGTFQCKLDSGSYSTCTSPKTYTGLADGSHTFSVRATDSVGNTDASPATRTWTIDTSTSGGTDPGPTPEFADDDDSVFEPAIERLAAAGITKGCNPPQNTNFCPNDPVTREQMAQFLAVALSLPAPSASQRTDFIDDNDSVFTASIEKLAFAGITKGCNPPVNTRFCPTDAVTREQMAQFLSVALNLATPSASQRTDFTDDNDSIFEPAIEKLAFAGITRGCNPPDNTKFCPTNTVTRGEMAQFLVNAGLA